MQKNTNSTATPNAQKITSSGHTSVLCQKVRWAREQAGWTQGQAAASMGVSRETFNRWEKGSAPIPPAKLHKLKHLAHVNFADFKPALVYDSKGYPHPFTKAEADKVWADHGDDEGALDAALEAFDIRLCTVEGDEYPERCWRRNLLATPEDIPVNDTPKAKKEFMALHADYFERLAFIAAVC